MFVHLNNILYKKNTPQLDHINEDQEFVPFLVQRWGSMYSPSLAKILNQTSNRYWSTLDNKEEWYKFLYTAIPKCTFKRITYLKKKKETTLSTKDKEVVQIIANNLEISSREVKYYVQEFDLKLPIKHNNTNDT